MISAQTDAPYLYDRSGNRYDVAGPDWRGVDGSPLMLSPVTGPAPDRIDTAERSLWRYQPSIPVDPRHRISLGEGFTPMPALDWRGHRIHFKLEWFNPTSSFKDRGVSVMMSHLRSLGAARVLEDSSGNGGTSVAAYSAAAGISAKILVPQSTSPAKVMQSRAFGAQIELVEGTRDAVGDEAIRQSERIPYASHNWHPLFLQGVKTIAYEMWETFGHAAPDTIVLVAGAGSLVLGCDIAFTELLAAGMIDRRPRLLVGQPEHWATIADTVNGRDLADRAARTPTIAEGASIAHPVRLPEVVAAVRRSNGGAVAVTETEIRSAVRELAARGLYAEPTSAVAAAALNHYLATGVIAARETTVVILTGSGLKSAL
ncbi:threonine synthase [Nocardia alni]|uniref:threonine synthase n=1 Tax=Nocardia alni TaxID=2815723 RepID=UPI001C244F9F|nr:threonine synthase [Nocardia alni]